MCGICGCGERPLTAHTHDHTPHDHHHDDVEQPVTVRRIKVEQDIFAKNNQYAQLNREYFRQNAIFALNFVSSPGSGKTSLLTSTITQLPADCAISVIEGDQQTTLDAEKIRATGVRALQINTGKGCHLDAHSIAHALQDQIPEPNSLVFIENVGNLVCPAAFDLGEAYKVVVLSVTEGEDKPLKYPDMFHAAELMILNKIDLLPYLDFDVEKCIDYARRINPRIKVLQLSVKTGQGMNEWLQWLTISQRLSSIA